MMKKSAAINDLKLSHHLIKLLMLIGVSIQQRISLQIYHKLTGRLIIKPRDTEKWCATHLRDNGDVRFYLAASAL